MEKQEYNAPELTEIGDVKEITEGNSSMMTHLDADFPVNTPGDQLTWS